MDTAVHTFEPTPEPAPRPSANAPQLRTLLLTDLVDSTGLIERLGDGPASDLFRAHDRLVLQLQQQWRGRLIDRSDGLLLLFERPIDGLGFALDYMRGLLALDGARDLELRARVGLHVGEVLTWRNSAEAVSVGAKPLEVEGLAKPMAARLMAMARPGQILLSAVAEPLAHRAARELGERGQHLAWKSWGRWRFKGVPDVQEIFEVGEPDLAPLRAPPSTPKAWRDIPVWRRPAALAAELALLVGGALSVWFLTRPEPAIAFAQRDWVVVGDLRNLTGQSALDDSLEQAFRISLEQSRYINVLSDLKARDTLQRMQRSPDTVLDRAVASEIALRDGARAVILPTVAEVGGRVRVSAEVIDPHTQTTVYAESAEGKGVDSALDSIDDVTAALRGQLGEAVKSIEKDSVPLPQVTTKSVDALRAYALGQKAFGQSRYADAKGFYRQAVELDPDFALAHLGLLRAYNGTADLEGGLAHLRRAQSLQDHLPPRDQLYLKAWVAQVDHPQSALDEWRKLAELYPDYFQAVANVGNALYMRHRYQEALPFARRATSPKSEFMALSWDLVGRLEQGLGRFPEAARAYSSALAGGVRTSSVRLAATYAAQRQFAKAESIWAKGSDYENVYFDHVSMQLDQGRWDKALTEAQRLAAAPHSDAARRRAAQVPLLAVYLARGDKAEALKHARLASRDLLAAIAKPTSAAEAADDAYAALLIALITQRLGERDLGRQTFAAIRAASGVANVEAVNSLLLVGEANDELLFATPGPALARLANTLGPSAPYQAHVVMLDAQVRSGNAAKSLAEAEWLRAHRGQAYAENGCGWCEQALNVYDSNLADLRRAEVLASSARPAEARRALAGFDALWKPGELPDYLRVRRAAVLSASN